MPEIPREYSQFAIIVLKTTEQYLESYFSPNRELCKSEKLRISLLEPENEKNEKMRIAANLAQIRKSEKMGITMELLLKLGQIHWPIMSCHQSLSFNIFFLSPEVRVEE